MLEDNVFFKTNTRILSIATVLLFIFLAFISFYNISFLPIRVFDESRQAINALEMYQRGNFIYTTFDGEVDFWNTKPPFLIWLQSGLMYIFGPNEIAIRFPSAISGILLSLILYYISIKYLKSAFIAIFSPLALFSIKGYIGIHALKTGDYDALLAFLVFGLLMSIYVYSVTYRGKYLGFANIFVTLAILTKGIAGLLFLPGIFIFLVIDGSLTSVLKNKLFLKSLFLPIIIGFGYYILREFYTPGYLKAVSENELGGRFGKALEGNSGTVRFYYDLLMGGTVISKKQLLLAFLAFPLALITKELRKITVYLVIVLISFLLIISLSATKLPWYLVPVFPIISLLSIITIYILGILTIKILKKEVFYPIFFLAFFIFLYGNSLMRIVNEVITPIETDKEVNALSYHLRDVKIGKTQVDTSYTYLNFEHYYPHIRFYQGALGIDKIKISNFNSFNLDTMPKRVAAYDSVIIRNISQNFDYQIKKRVSGFVFFDIKNLKYNYEEYSKEYSQLIGNKSQIRILLNKQDSTKLVLEIANKDIKFNKPILPFVFKTINNNIQQTEVIELPKWDGINTENYSIKFVQLQGKFLAFVP